MKSIRRVVEPSEPGNITCANALKKFCGNNVMEGINAMNTASRIFWVALEARATVGGRSKYGATMTINVSTIKNNETNLAQCFTATTLNNSTLYRASLVKYREADQLGSIWKWKITVDQLSVTLSVRLVPSECRLSGLFSRQLSGAAVNH